ncbi:MAG: hypothetical protein HC875_31515 [Anaerolineales bacterium]|nr:hypothetical protein [Anaerolineales bacterium]
MIQDTKNLKAEIISALDFLPADNLKLLAKFVAFLQTNTAQDVIEKVDIPQRTIRISSPRLAQREHVADFKKEVVWETKE